ncbi:hypothetical protein DY000_02048087 [Brassica cretica]|uniref:Uncharacterized protein n=1 Tax=Brassica cretica TaxID=69181 RepID=A0ABQ7F8C8_BRACR|nr:hypothetical protein DY000_02048087 [Brassica cretica]
MNSDFPTSLVGGRVRPCRLFTDPFSSPVASFGEVSETDSEVIRRKYGIHSSVQMRSSLEFEHAPDGGPGEIAIFEAYLVASFRGIVPSLVGEVSSFLGFYPSQLTPSSWKTLISIQVLGELYGLDTGMHEVLYSYYFAPLTIMPGLYHLRLVTALPWLKSLQEGPGVVTPLETTVPVVVGLLTTDFAFRCVSSGILSWGNRGENDVGDSSTFTWSALPDEQGGPASVVFGAGARRRRPFYAPPPRLTRVTPPAARTRPLPSRTVIGDSLLMGVRQRLFTELFLLRNREGLNAGILKKNIVGICLVLKDRIITLEGALKSLEDPEVLSLDPEIVVGPGGEATTGTCWDFAFYLSEAGHYRVPVLHAAFCRMPLSDLEGAGVGENPSARLCYFPRLEK